MKWRDRISNAWWTIVARVNRRGYLRHVIRVEHPFDNPAHFDLIEELLCLETDEWTRRGAKVNVWVHDIPVPDGYRVWKTADDDSRYISWETVSKLRMFVEDAEYEKRRRRRVSLDNLFVRTLFTGIAFSFAVMLFGQYMPKSVEKNVKRMRRELDFDFEEILDNYVRQCKLEFSDEERREYRASVQRIRHAIQDPRLLPAQDPRLLPVGLDEGVRQTTQPYGPRRSIALASTVFVVVGLGFAIFYSAFMTVGISPLTLLVSATSGRFQYIDGTQEYGLTIIPSSPREYLNPIRFRIEASKDGQFVGEPSLDIPKVETPKGLKPKFGVTPDRVTPNEDCYTLEGVRGGRDKLSIRYIIRSATPLPDSARLRVVPVGNVRVVEQNSR